MLTFKTLLDNVGKLSNKNDNDNGSICYQYSDTSDDESYTMKPEEEQCNMLSM